MIAFKTSEIRQFMVKAGINNSGPDTVISYIKGFSKSNMDAYIASGFNVHVCTVGVNEALILPFDWVWAEKCGDGQDVLGVKVAFFLQSDEEAMTSVNRWLIAVRKVNNYLVNALEVLNEGVVD